MVNMSWSQMMNQFIIGNFPERGKTLRGTKNFEKSNFKSKQEPAGCKLGTSIGVLYPHPDTTHPI